MARIQIAENITSGDSTPVLVTPSFTSRKGGKAVIAITGTFDGATATIRGTLVDDAADGGLSLGSVASVTEPGAVEVTLPDNEGDEFYVYLSLSGEGVSTDIDAVAFG